MCGDRLGVFDRAAVFEVRGDASGVERVVARASRKAGGSGTPLNHPKHVIRGHPIDRKHIDTADGGTKERPLEFVADAGGGDVRIEIRLGVVMRGNFVMFAAFFVEAKPPAFSVLPVVADVHSDDGADSGEAENHHADERAVTESDDCGRVDRVEKLAGLRGGQHRRLAFLNDVFRTANAPHGIDLKHSAGHEKVEAHANRSEVLFDGGSRVRACKRFDVRGDGERVDVVERKFPMVTPTKEASHREGVRDARVLVADGGREEFDEPLRGLFSGGVDDRREPKTPGHSHASFPSMDDG